MENPIDIAKSVFDTVSNSGTAIFRTDVGYAIVGQTSEAIQRIAITLDANFPLSIVGRYDPDHPIMKNADPFVLKNASKSGTIDLLMNAGPIHDEIARLALESGMGVFGSSANMSLSGSKYDFKDVEIELRNKVDLALDGGKTKFSHPDGLGSTIIDLDTFEPFRIGIRFQEIRKIAKDKLNIDIGTTIIKP
ncbi:MAG: hypothetical protein EBX03_13675 [Rhodobacteraceae bacterium]|nr:hypothetical protein [Paracoccaceae bacterium]